MQWENELRTTCKCKPPENIPESDFFPLTPPPDIDQIAGIVQSMRNGTAPGPDRLNIELIKFGPFELMRLIHLVISKAWISNDIPTDWLLTTQVPIPKITHPKSVDDFRRIALSGIIYKIYARFVLQQLEMYIGNLPLYQAGFLKNRSTDDHLFTIRRVTEERWRKGVPTYILAIDLKKAFDRVELQVISGILQKYGVPSHLINRIITAILHERTAVQ